MFRFYKILVLVAFFALLANSCEDTSSNLPTDVIKVTFSDIQTTPGNEWFKVSYDTYQPDSNYCNQIAQTFKTANYKFGIYCKLSCGCANTQLRAAQCYRVLKQSGIPDSLIEIYSMSRITMNHPHMSNYTVNSLPAILIMKQTQVLPSVLDSLERNDSTRNIPIEKYISIYMNK